MVKYEHYLPVVLMALTILILGCSNPKAFQARDRSSKQPSGHPSYVWLAGLGLLVGALAVWFYNQGSSPRVSYDTI